MTLAPPHVSLMLMAGAARRTMRTVAATGRFPLLFIPTKDKYNSDHHDNQDSRNQNRCKICTKPRQHDVSLLSIHMNCQITLLLSHLFLPALL